MLKLTVNQVIDAGLTFNQLVILAGGAENILITLLDGEVELLKARYVSDRQVLNVYRSCEDIYRAHVMVDEVWSDVSGIPAYW